MTGNIGEPILRYFKWTHTNVDMDIFNYASWLDNKRNPEVGFYCPVALCVWLIYSAFDS